MADSKVIIEIVSTAKGLKVVAKDTETLAKNVNKVDTAQKKADKSGKNYHKTEKGIHQANLSSAKGFSKMNQSIGGSSGLVGAYATLAANVFAATAAFNALRSSAQVETLIEGFTFLAASAGRSADVVASSVQRITDNALSMEDAFRASAIAITSGFSTTQLEKLVSVGKNASIALGRNLGDSVDRLIRGVAKLEPEILDELGIMVRLDTATTKYAATLGKTAKDLTDFERRQAFLNEAISQGETKYSALEGSVSVNSFDKLSGTFSNLTHNVLAFVNTAIKPLLAVFANSQVAMFGAVMILAKGVIGTMFPVLTDLGTRFQTTAEKASKAAIKIKGAAEEEFKGSEAKVGGMKAKKGDPAGFVALQKSAKKGTSTVGEMKTAMNGLNKSIALREKTLAKTEVKDRKTKEAQLERIRKMKKATQELIDKEEKRGRAGARGIRASSNERGAGIIAEGAGAIGGMGGGEGIMQAFRSTKEYNAELRTTSTELKKTYGSGTRANFKKFGTSAMTGFKMAGGGAKLFGAALVNAIPLIGQIIFVVGLLFTAFKKLTSFSGKTGEALSDLGTIGKGVGDKILVLDKIKRKLTEANEELGREITFLTNKTQTEGDANKILQLQFKQTVNETLKLNAELRVSSGIMGELSSATEKLGESLTLANPSKFQAFWAGTTKEFKKGKDEGTGFGGVLADITGFLSKSPVVSFFLPIQDETKKTAAKLTIFENGINKTLEAITDPGMKAKMLASFGKEGLAGMIIRLQAEGKTFDEIQRAVNESMGTVAETAAKQLDAIDSLAPGYEELTKKIIAFSDRAKKKNAFITLGEDVGTFNKKLNTLATTQGGDIAAIQSQLNTVISPEMIEQLAAMGISYDNIAQSVVKNVDAQGNVTFELKGSLTTLQESLNTHGLEAEILKEKLATMKATTDSAIKKSKFEQLSLEIAQRQTALAERGTYQQTPEQLQVAATAKEKSEKKQSELTRANVEEMAKKTRDHAIKGAELEFGLTDERYTNEKKFQDALFEQKVADALALKILTDTQAEDALAKTRDTAGQSGTTLDRIGSVQEAGFSTAGFQEQIKMMEDSSQPMLDKLKALGPDGELAAAAVEGTLSIASSISTIGTAGLKSAEGVQAAADIIGTVGGIMAANSKAQIAEVDKQIAAEKNRDGKSKESLAKIKAMEKKKEQMKRKAFEQNKKMQIAETIIGTAAAIMKAAPDLPLQILQGVMGAMQLAVIQKTSYQGGGGSIEQPKKQTLAIGKRNNKVDVSKATSGGELAFLRGAQGIGSNANNFRPGGAAGMKRSYAAGGEILVGEQGPEVIKPTADGYNVIPNDRMGGGTTNANFTINAVDAAGVAEVLTAQRGNIISMIREAAHEHGEEFIEAVNTGSYLEK